MHGNDKSLAASIASTGFACPPICIGEKRWLHQPRGTLISWLCRRFHFCGTSFPLHRGFYFHFANVNTGERMWDS